jgi:nucleotide-binding universal stress UspA family protein
MEFSRKERIDLMIMTTHGKGGIKRAVMGSITDEVVRGSGKPVLVVNPQARRK